MNELVGYQVHETDGEVGQIDDFYFDNLEWVIRYAVVETGKWFFGKDVLISTHSFRKPNWEDKLFPVTLSKAEIEKGPEVDLAEPVSQEKERELLDYYSWPPYWGTGVGIGSLGTPTPRPVREVPSVNEKSAEDNEVAHPHLRSFHEVKGYNIKTTDGEIGHVQDFIVDDENWLIRYMVVDTRNWLPGGKKVLVAPEWITGISWGDQTVQVDLSKDLMEHSPEFDPIQMLNRDYEEMLYDHYGRPRYWS